MSKYATAAENAYYEERRRYWDEEVVDTMVTLRFDSDPVRRAAAAITLAVAGVSKQDCEPGAEPENWRPR